MEETLRHNSISPADKNNFIVDSTLLHRTIHGDETPSSAKRLKRSNDLTSAVTPIVNKEPSGPLSQQEALKLLQETTGLDVSQTKTKRTDYLQWDDYFMAVVFLSAQRSKDPTAPTGACLVNDENLVVGIGYNGFPRGCSDDVLPWQCNSFQESIPWLHTRNAYECHAEINAILNKCSANVKGTRLYVAHFPCTESAKVILQSGIREVIYMKDTEPNKEEYVGSRLLLKMAGVKTRQYTPTIPNVELNFVESMAPTSIVSQEEEEDKDKEDQATLVHDKITKYKNLMAREAPQLDITKSHAMKNQDYLSWDDYFIAIAFLTAQRSKDPNTQVGACIVDSHKRIVGLGYNGFPRNTSDDVLPWSRVGCTKLHTKYMYVCHAEVNAILNKCSETVENCTLYVALFPCNECAKMIIQAGISQVVYLSDCYHDTDSCRASRIMLEMARVKTRQYIPTKSIVKIDFEEESSRK